MNNDISENDCVTDDQWLLDKMIFSNLFVIILYSRTICSYNNKRKFVLNL